MFDGRIYRAAFLPLLFVLVIVGFSLSGRPGRLSSTLAPDAFDGARAFSTLNALSAGFPDRQPGSSGDRRLARYVAQAISTAGGSSQRGFQVSLHSVRAHTVAGERTLTTVVAQRPGSTGQSPIAIVAHRDAARRGSAAELSGTAALIELARVFAHSETQRTIVLVSTSGGSGGDAGAAWFAHYSQRPIDAAIVLGDLAGARAQKPFVSGFSADSRLAPEQLLRTLDASISQEVGVTPGEPGLGVQLAHLAFPLVLGEQTPLERAGIPAALIQVSGEHGPAAGEAVSESRLQGFGRAVLSTVYALDESPDLESPSGARLTLGRKLMPGWAVRLLVFALLLPVLVACIDALARLRRRRQPFGALLIWTVSCGVPLFAAALFAMLLGRLGIVAAPAGQPPAQALASIGSAPAATLASVLVLVLALLSWPALVRRLGLPLRPAPDAGAVAVMLVLVVVCLIVWLLNPFACLLLLTAAHACLLACSPAGQRRAVRALAVVLALVPLAALLVVYATDLGLGPGGLAESAVLLLAGGQINLLAALLWSLALGCLLTVLLLGRDQAPRVESTDEPDRILTRGPLSYAGPGSLGGTESALRR
ncbi:MAG: M28 family peptidase [Solirubrobacteraceae bacterium]